MAKFSIVAKPDINSLKCYDEVLSSLTCNGWVLDENYPNYIIVIGGDGTMLRAIHKYMHILDSVQFLGIHTGTLGFYTEYDLAKRFEALSDLLNNNNVIEYKSLLEVEVTTSLEKLNYYAINEMRLENIMRTQVIELAIDNEHLETIRANGVCVSTPSGSTAYNKSLGGAVIYPNIDVIQLCEVAGIHHNKYHSLGSPIIVSSNQVISLTSSDFSNISLVFDHVVVDSQDIKRVDCRLSKRKVAFLRNQKYSFAQRIRNSFISD
jgi:NAD+ kinase